jgi:hypothetical protein
MLPLRRLQPALAALLAACVLLLGLAAWSPELHEKLCAHEHAVAHDPAHDHCSGDHAEHAPAAPAEEPACAVTLFASGCAVAPTAIPLSPPLGLSAARVTAFTELLFARTLRGPDRVCGPPALA